MDRDLGTGNAIYANYQIEPNVERLIERIMLNTDGNDIVPIEFPELTRTIQELDDAMRRMGISIEDWAESCLNFSLPCNEVSGDKTDDALQDSPELDEFLSKFVVTQKDEVS